MYEDIPHGTRIFVLPLSAIHSAAQADVERYRRNTEGKWTGAEVYAFHRLHVRKAMRRDNAGGADIVEIALKDIGRGLEGSKRELYLQLQEQHENPPDHAAQ